MGKIKQRLEEIKKQQDESSDILKEFNVKVVDDEHKGKFFIGYVKAKTKESAINKMAEDFKGKPFSYYIV